MIKFNNVILGYVNNIFSEHILSLSLEKFQTNNKPHKIQ